MMIDTILVDLVNLPKLCKENEAVEILVDGNWIKGNLLNYESTFLLIHVKDSINDDTSCIVDVTSISAIKFFNCDTVNSIEVEFNRLK